VSAEPGSAAPAIAPAVVRGVGVAVAVTALLRFAAMFQDASESEHVLEQGFEPIFDYCALAVLVALGGWLVARPGRARPALGIIAGVTPWAVLPIVGDVGLIARRYDWVEDYAPITPLLMLQVVALLAVVWLVCRAASRARTARPLLPLGLAAVALWTSLAAMLWLTSGELNVVASAQVSRVGLGLAAGTVVVFSAAGARAWAGWTVGAWIGAAGLWMLGAGLNFRAQEMQLLPAVLLVALLLAAAALLVLRMRGDRGVEAPHVGLGTVATRIALGAAGLATAGFALVLSVQLEQTTYTVEPYVVARLFEVYAGPVVLLGGVLLLAVRRSAGAAAYCVGAAAGPVSLLGAPELVDNLHPPGVAGLVLVGLAALVLVAVLVRSAPTRPSWPWFAVATACVLLVAGTSTAEPFTRLDLAERWIMLVVIVAIPVAVLWKGGMVTAGALFGVAAGSAGEQFLTVYRRIDDVSGPLLGAAVLATLLAAATLAHAARRETSGVTPR
jgi:hypothetical protein